MSMLRRPHEESTSQRGGRKESRPHSLVSWSTVPTAGCTVKYMLVWGPSSDGAEGAVTGPDDEVRVCGQRRVAVHGGAQVNVEQCCPGGVEPDDMAGLGAPIRG